MRRRPSLLLALFAVVSGLCSCGGNDVGPGGTPLDTNEPWDLVWISDSMGWRVAEAWADLIEEYEDVEVRVHNDTVGFQSLVGVGDLLSENAIIREKVAGAEIIVVYGNNSATGPADYQGTCHSTSTTPRTPPRVPTTADFEPYGDALRDVLEIVFELRAGQPTVIRTFDSFNGYLADWRDAGIEPECTSFWESESAALRDAAEDYGVTFVSFYDDFNGPNHGEDPREKGYIDRDGYHASVAGSDAQADLLHATGYDAITP